MNAKKIIEDIRNGGLKEQQAIERIYDQCWPKVQPLKGRDLSSEELGGFYIDAIIKFRGHIKSGKGSNIDDICAYIRQITKNTWVGDIKKEIKAKKGHEGFYAQNTSSESIEDMIDQPLLEVEKDRLIEEARKKIGDKCLEIILKKELGWPMKEIAESCNLKDANSAKTALYKCRKKLKKFLDGRS